MLRRDFAEMLKEWLADLEPHCRDLEAAGIEHKRDNAVIDFHSFRCYRVTRCIMSGASSPVVMSAVRLSSESLLAQYSKISEADVAG
jgi:hypothetical protein